MFIYLFVLRIQLLFNRHNKLTPYLPYLLCLYPIVNSPLIQAQADNSTSAAYVLEKQRHFDAETLNDFRNNSDYLYDRTPPSSTTMWDDFLRWLSDISQDWLPNSKAINSVFDILQYLLVILLLFVLLSVIFKLNFSHLFFKRSAKSRKRMRYEVLDENIHALNFSALIADAVAQTRYRKAIRLYYLQALKQLTDRKLIDWQINKTNHEYLNELRSTNLHQAFDRLTFIFDYTWYGNFSLSPSDFKDIETKFRHFEQSIKKA